MLDNPQIIRTDFSDEHVWSAILEAITSPNAYGFAANLTVVNDKDFADMEVEQLIQTIAEDDFNFFFVVDHYTISHPQHPILCIGKEEDQDKQFRVLPSSIWAVENNLSIANMDFDDFMVQCDANGVFEMRGF